MKEPSQVSQGRPWPRPPTLEQDTSAVQLREDRAASGMRQARRARGRRLANTVGLGSGGAWLSEAHPGVPGLSAEWACGGAAY